MSDDPAKFNADQDCIKLTTTDKQGSLPTSDELADLSPEKLHRLITKYGLNLEIRSNDPTIDAALAASNEAAEANYGREYDKDMSGSYERGFDRSYERG